MLSLILINKKYKTFTEITTKRTEITGTSCRYMFTGLKKKVSFITLSNMLMISSKKMWKNTKKPEVVILHVFSLPLHLGREETEASLFFYWMQNYEEFTPEI